MKIPMNYYENTNNFAYYLLLVPSDEPSPQAIDCVTSREIQTHKQLYLRLFFGCMYLKFVWYKLVNIMWNTDPRFIDL